MGFTWFCPECDHKNEYGGDKTLDANSTCSNCKKTMRIWKHRVVEKKIVFPTKSNKIQPKKLELPTIPTKFYTPQSFMAKVLRMLETDLNTTLLEDKKKRLIRVLTANDPKGNNYAWVRDCIMILIDYCIQKELIR